MPCHMIGMGVGYKGNPLSAVGIQPQFGLRKEDAAFDELIWNRGFQGRIRVQGTIAEMEGLQADTSAGTGPVGSRDFY